MILTSFFCHDTLKKRSRDRHLFGVSLVTSFPDSLSV